MSARVSTHFVLRLAAVVMVAILVGPSSACTDALTPESGGSPNADEIDTLYRITPYVAIVIFLIVEGTLIWSLARQRAARRLARGADPRQSARARLDRRSGADPRGVLTGVTFFYLDEIENPPASGPDGRGPSQARFASIDQPEPPGDRPYRRIEVNGQQYLRRYDYPGDQRPFSYHTMVVPVDTAVMLEVSASDVIHSWWIRKLGGKVDGVPGHVNKTLFKVPADEAGTTLSGQCGELCWAGHADARAEVRAAIPEEFESGAGNRCVAIRRAGADLAAQRGRREGGEGR